MHNLDIMHFQRGLLCSHAFALLLVCSSIDEEHPHSCCTTRREGLTSLSYRTCSKLSEGTREKQENRWVDEETEMQIHIKSKPARETGGKEAELRNRQMKRQDHTKQETVMEGGRRTGLKADKVMWLHVCQQFPLKRTGLSKCQHSLEDWGDVVNKICCKHRWRQTALTLVGIIIIKAATQTISFSAANQIVICILYESCFTADKEISIFKLKHCWRYRFGR